MNLKKLKEVYKSQGCKKIFIKKLAPNDNSKNQVYLGGSFEVLNIFPFTEIVADSSGNWKRDRFKASLNFYWLQDDGNIYNAPRAQLILYPKYPEVRFSGFLSKCENPPPSLMTTREANRLLFLGVSSNGKIIGYVTSSNSSLAEEFNSQDFKDTIGVFTILYLIKANNKSELIKELTRIHLLGWIDSKRLDKNGKILPCKSSNCGGYTLEAELGITPNGFSEPDYLGWEIKQFGVSNFEKIRSKVITLMTPEPNGGDYKELGVNDFLHTYGYEDKLGRPDRINFGGIHKIGDKHPTTKLTLKLIGFDSESNKIRNSDGRIALVTDTDREAASWSFASLLKHWNRKHNQACYLPSLSQTSPTRKYHFGDRAILGIGTDFTYFLKEMISQNIYYDPGIKMENVSTKPKVKRRSQFRIKSGNLKNLYQSNEEILFDEE